jgi:hypothetical protein
MQGIWRWQDKGSTVTATGQDPARHAFFRELSPIRAHFSRAISAGIYPVWVNQDEDLIDPVKYRG